MPHPTTTTDPIITTLRTTRQTRGIDQNTIAHATGVDRTSVTGWENGRAQPPLPRLRAWAAVLGYDLILVAAGGYTPEQQARADAVAAASHVLAAAVQSGGMIVIKEGDGILGLGAALVKLARPLATWIEHGGPAPATLAEHVESAIGLVDIRDVPDFGDRIDQALDAAKMAQARARPTQT